MIKILSFEKYFHDAYLIENRFNAEVDPKICTYFNFVRVSNFNQAIKFLEQQSFDLLLIRFFSCSRSEPSRFSIALSIRAQFPLIPIIFSTYLEDEKLTLQVVGKNLNIYLIKEPSLIKTLTSIFLNLNFS